MKLVSFRLKESSSARSELRIGALLGNGEHILDFNAMLRSTDQGLAESEPTDLLAWFNLDGELIQRARALHNEIATSARDIELIRERKGIILRTDSRLHAPVPRPGKIICIGLNYRDHAIESKMPIPNSPVIFSKFTTSVIGTDEAVALPIASAQVDYEAELAVVIGRRAKYVTLERAFDYVLGYTNFNDVSARDFQFADGQWQRGKSCDTFAPMGPFLATRDEIADPHALSIKFRLNGQTMQDSNTNQLIFGIPELIAHLSETITLEPGDVIATGTPPGVGFARTPPVFLRPGDLMEVEIKGLGILSNVIAD